MSLILVGQPELKRILQLNIYDAITQRIGMRYHLAAIDNAPMESFFSTIKVEWLRDTSKMIIKHVINEIMDYMELYNTILIKSEPMMTPFEKRKMAA